MSANLQVTQLVTQLEPAGAQTMASWLHHALSEQYSVDTVFIYDKSGSDLFPNPHVLAKNRPHSVSDFLKFTRELWRFSREHRDVVIAHTHYAIAMSVMLRFSSNPSIIAVHHGPLDRYPRLARLALALGRKLRRFAAEVYVSPTIAPTSESLVIVNPLPKPGPYSDRVDLKPDVLIVGRHAPEKAIDVALAAMSELPDRRLMVVGAGELTDSLKSLALQLKVSERVSFTGKLSNSEVRSLMQKCSVFLLPSRWEAMPIALLEAVAESTVIVASDIQAHQFLLSEGAAIPFHSESADSLAEALRHSENIDLQQQIIRNQQRIKDRFRSDQIASQWVELVADCNTKSRK